MYEDLASTLGGGAISGMQQAETRNSGFFKWLSENYGQLTGSFRDVACIIRPDTCAGGANGQPPVIVREDTTTKNYFLILGVLLLLVLVVLLVN